MTCKVERNLGDYDYYVSLFGSYNKDSKGREYITITRYYLMSKQDVITLLNDYEIKRFGYTIIGTDEVTENYLESFEKIITENEYDNWILTDEEEEDKEEF